MVAKNFKFLYRYYNDKQEALAKMFDKPQSTISGYVNGTIPIPVDILKQLANRYNESANRLINVDLSAEYDSPQTMMMLNNLLNTGDEILPFPTSKVAKSNDNFNLARKILSEERLVDDIEVFHSRVSVYEHIITLFQKAWEECNSYVALSNALSTILAVYASYNQTCIKIVQELNKKYNLNFYDLQKGMLRNPKKGNSINLYEEQQKKFFNKYDDIVYENIRHLKENARFSELGDYYLALCYYIGFKEDFIEYEQCVQTGFYMLMQLLKIENKYAEKFFENLMKIS